MKLHAHPLWFISMPLILIGLGIIIWKLGFIVAFGIFLFSIGATMHDGHAYN